MTSSSCLQKVRFQPRSQKRLLFFQGPQATIWIIYPAPIHRLTLIMSYISLFIFLTVNVITEQTVYPTYYLVPDLISQGGLGPFSQEYLCPEEALRYLWQP